MSLVFGLCLFGFVSGCSLSVTTDTLNFSFCSQQGTAYTLAILTINFEGPLCPLIGAMGLGFVPFALVVLPVQLFETFALSFLSLPGRCTGEAFWRHL